MDYSNFEVEDFASDDYFIRWVLENDAEATRFWETFRLKNADIADKIDSARSLILDLQRAERTSYTPQQIEGMLAKIQNRISFSAARRSFVLKIAAAISIVALASSSWYGVRMGYFSNNNPLIGSGPQPDECHLVEAVNTTGKAVTISLSDGSTVRLENNSTLGYYDTYAGKHSREVYLTGEAFFDIARNPRQPFLVYANDVVTRVLGTSFRVKAYNDQENILVSVKEGKVSVYPKAHETRRRDVVESVINGVVLTPNQQVVYERSDNSFNKTIVDSPQIIDQANVQYDFTFNNTPVKEVFRVLKDAYGVEIIFNEEVTRNCYLTAPLGDEPLFEKLKIICRTIGARYELIDAKIVINTIGCGESIHQKPS